MGVPRLIHLFDVPQRFVAGTVGVPGERTFFLQAVDGQRVVSVALEKVQVTALAAKLLELLDEVRRRGVAGATLVGSARLSGPDSGRVLEDVGPLAAPVEEEFRVGTMALAWDGDEGMVVVEAMAQRAPGAAAAEPLTDAAEDGPDVLRVRLQPAQVRSFVRRAQRVVAAGRRPCYLCGLPLDPEGHRCPRLN